jgi:hypothetical protein
LVKEAADEEQRLMKGTFLPIVIANEDQQQGKSSSQGNAAAGELQLLMESGSW